MEVALVGGTGKTGRAVQAALTAAGVETRSLGRAAFADLPGELAGVDAVHLVAPNLHPDEPSYVRSVLDAALAAGVARVVYHSVASPYVPAMPHHLGKAVAEDLVRRSGLDWTILQPCAYVQNLLPALRGGELTVPYALDKPFGLVDLDDVGEAVAEVLATPGHVGATYELGGPALVTMTDVAAAAGVPVRRVDPEPGTHPWLRAMFDYYDDFGLPTGPVPLAALLGRAPTDVAEVLGRELGWQELPALRPGIG